MIKSISPFWIALLLLVCFEAANVYFIMPMPGSQQIDSLEVAYFLYRWRWFYRVIFGIGLLAGLFKDNYKRKWLQVASLVLVGLVVYMINFQMAADKMFRQVKTLRMVKFSENQIDSNRLVIGVSVGNEARAYPISLLGYHHLVEDSISGQPILVTYCTVCRTGRVFSPQVNGIKQAFRLVGMDHFNAMIEDERTGSWWRQATGEAVAGKEKGKRLTEIMSEQTTLAEWQRHHPNSLVMQSDPAYKDVYPQTFEYENGNSRNSLTGTNPKSWQDKSWVVGIELDGNAIAFDWNALAKQKLIQYPAGGKMVLLALAKDGKSFYAYTVGKNNQALRLSGDTIWSGEYPFSIAGKALYDTTDLQKISAYQEFWHSWKTFHPDTRIWPDGNIGGENQGKK
jgi:hypothetical protein